MDTTAAAAAAAAALPDDAIEEILLRVDDAAALFRCTTACKPWRALVAAPSFLHRHWPEDSPESCCLFGFFAPQRRKIGPEQIFVPAPRSPLGRCSLRSFFPEAAADGLLEHAEPITSRHGLLLLRVHSSSPPGGIKLAVCNPLAGTFDVLPTLERYNTDFDRNGCAILTAADLPSKGADQKPLPGYSTFFRVLLCAHNDVWGSDSNRLACGYHLHTFSSDEPAGWTEPRDCFTQINGRDLYITGCAVVCRRGTAHWLLSTASDYYALQVSADAGHVSFTKLAAVRPDDYHRAWFHVGTDGALWLLVHRHNFILGDTIQVWTCRDHGDSAADWIRIRRITLEEGSKKKKRQQNVEALTSLLRMIGLDLDRPKQKHKVGTPYGTLLFGRSTLHFADLTTGAMEDITARFTDLDARYFVPFEVSWKDFFSFRLLRGRKEPSGATSLS